MTNQEILDFIMSEKKKVIDAELQTIGKKRIAKWMEKYLDYYTAQDKKYLLALDDEVAQDAVIEFLQEEVESGFTFTGCPFCLISRLNDYSKFNCKECFYKKGHNECGSMSNRDTICVISGLLDDYADGIDAVLTVEFYKKLQRKVKKLFKENQNG